MIIDNDEAIPLLITGAMRPILGIRNRFNIKIHINCIKEEKAIICGFLKV